MSVRTFRLVSKICVKNILRIFQAHFRENVKNTEPGRKFHHSYKKKRVSYVRNVDNQIISKEASLSLLKNFVLLTY